jgi:deoxyribonuclease-4
MIRFGPAGIPLSSKGRTLKDGVQDVHTLGLGALEVQFLRVHTIERFATDDEIGQKVRDLQGELVVQVVREGVEGDEYIWDLNHVIESGDMLVSLSSPVAPSYKDLAEIGALAKELDVYLSLHTPYYMNLAQPRKDAFRSMQWAIWGGLLAAQMDAAHLATNVGIYSPEGPEASLKYAVENLTEVQNVIAKANPNLRLAVKPSGKKEVFGTLDEVLALCDQLRTAAPVVSFPEIHARTEGSLRESKDFARVFDRTRRFFRTGPFYANFSGVEWGGLTEMCLTPVKRGDLKFEPLGEYLIEANPDMICISSSPLLEHDAMYMRVIFERILARKEARVKVVREKGLAPAGIPTTGRPELDLRLAREEAKRLREEEKKRKAEERESLKRLKEEERLKKQKEREEERLRKQKEKERIKAEKDKERERLRAQKEKERARQAKEKETARLKKLKELERARAAKEKERLRLQKQRDLEKRKRDVKLAQERARRETEAARARAKRIAEMKKKAERKQKEQRAKKEREAKERARREAQKKKDAARKKAAAAKAARKKAGKKKR